MVILEILSDGGGHLEFVKNCHCAQFYTPSENYHFMPVLAHTKQQKKYTTFPAYTLIPPDY